MNDFFKPYEGLRPFLFISYAHRQSEQVVGTIRILHEQKYRLWYDEGIPAGSDWPANIASHVQNCEKVIFFLSERALASPNCFSEIRTAARLRKPILTVRLDESEPGAEWQELLSPGDVIPLMDTNEARAAAILASGFVSRRFHYSWTEKLRPRYLLLAASILLFAGAAGALAAVATGVWQPLEPPAVPAFGTEAPEEPVTVPVIDIGDAEKAFAIAFPDAQQEKAVRKALGNQDEPVYRWQLAEIKELYLCGNMVTDSLDPVTFDPDGTCRVNGAPVITGAASDLSLFTYMLRLEKLALIDQPAADFSYIDGLPSLRELSLAGCDIDDIGFLTDMPSLRVLHLEHTGVKDLSALTALDGLAEVSVSGDMLPLTWPDDAGWRVVLTPDDTER